MQSALAPVFTTINQDTDFKGVDYVDWSETETIATPKAVELCKNEPKRTLESLKEDLEKAVKKV
ncbi:MAG: HdeA/HdeB family chaperone [Hafnia alvei]